MSQLFALQHVNVYSCDCVESPTGSTAVRALTMATQRIFFFLKSTETSSWRCWRSRHPEVPTPILPHSELVLPNECHNVPIVVELASFYLACLFTDNKLSIDGKIFVLRGTWRTNSMYMRLCVLKCLMGLQEGNKLGTVSIPSQKKHIKLDVQSHRQVTLLTHLQPNQRTLQSKCFFEETPICLISETI